MKTTILILSILFTTLTSCNSNDNNETGYSPTLPPVTTTGANTFGCYIDGKLLLPRDGDGTFGYPSHAVDYFVSGNVPTAYKSSLTVHDYKSGNAGMFQLNIENTQNGIGEYLIKESNCQEWVSGNPPPTINLLVKWKDEQTEEVKYYCSIEDTGTLNILKYDYANGILSATFSCSVVNYYDPNDIIEITEGRFDITWRTVDEKEFP